MKRKKVLILTLLLIIIGLIIFTGCGGGSNNLISSPSITNQNPTNTPINTGAYLTINITWPQNNSPGNIIMSSGDEENNLTASMPNGVNKIIVKIREAPDLNDPNAPPDDPGSYQENGYTEILPPPNTIESTVTLGPLTGAKVIVRVETYDNKGLLSIAEKEQVLKIDQLEIDLDLGSTNIYVKVPPIFLEGILNGEPDILPLKKSETYIKTRISLESPDLLPKPTPSPTAYIPKENNTMQSQETVGVENIKVRYTIVGGYGALTTDGINYSQSVTVNSDYNGNCNPVNLRADSHLDMYIRYDYFLDRNNPDTISYTDIQDTEVFGLYAWQVVANPPQIQNIPGDSTVKVGLFVDHSDFPYYYIPPAAAQNKKIFFEVIDPNTGGSFNPTEAFTGNDGICSSIFKLLVEGITVNVRYVFPIYPELYPQSSPYYYVEGSWIPDTSSGKSSTIEASGNKNHIFKEKKRGFVRYDENNNQVIEELPDPNIPLQIQNCPDKISFPYKDNLINLKTD
ncbi:MAG: hypothetical protein ABRQ38_23820, partial [Candidatus Eremiobacterota bacterium]